MVALTWPHKVMLRCLIVLVVFPVVQVDLVVQIQCKGVVGPLVFEIGRG